MRRFLDGMSRGTIMRLAASIGLALILWSWVTTLLDPETTRTYTGVPLTIEGLAESLVMVDPPDETQVRVTGPESLVEVMSISAIHATIDASDVSGPGSYELPIRIEAPDDIWRTASSPATATVDVEASVVSEFELEIMVQDLDASSLRTVQVEPEVNTVIVRGPSSVIDQVVRVALPVETSGGSRVYETTVAPEALDADGLPVEGVTLEPGEVAATVTVAARGKSVAVLVSTEGSPAPGYEVIDRTANPVSVVVEGPPAALEQLIAVSAEPIDITGASTSVSATVKIIDLPEDVTVIQPSSGTVDVLVQIGQQGVRQSLTGLEIEVANLAPGMTATVSPDVLTIEVMAPESVLSALTVESFQVIVDAAGLNEGVYTMQPLVIVPAEVQWITATPVDVELTIRASPDSTPEA
ncbi:MAG: YbbR-like domain-containing protein [Thermomicrobiales bacterium]